MTHKLLFIIIVTTGITCRCHAAPPRTLFSAPFSNLTTDDTYTHAVAGLSDYVGIILNSHESVILVERLGKQVIEVERLLQERGLTHTDNNWHIAVARELRADTLLTGHLSQNEHNELIIGIKAIDIDSEQVLAVGHQTVVDHQYHTAIERLADRFAEKLKLPPLETNHLQHDDRPLASLYFGKGLSRYYSGNLDAAIMNFNKALAYDPDYIEAHYYSGLAYLQLDELIPAQIEWRQLLKKKPDFPLGEDEIKTLKQKTGWQMPSPTSPESPKAMGNIEPQVFTGITRLIQPPRPEDYTSTTIHDPYATTRWPTSVDYSSGYKLRADTFFGKHGKNQLFYLGKRNWFTHSKGRFQLHGGKIFAEDCRFDNIPFAADHSGSCYFVDCIFNGCTIKEHGRWHHKWRLYDSKWYFENCRFTNKFNNGNFDMNRLGLCATRCTFDQVELPSYWYHGKEPADRRLDQWMTISLCRFQNCTVPLSFLLLTSQCVFTNCEFVDDAKPNEFKKPLKLTYYAENIQNRISDLPTGITLSERPLIELKKAVGSTLETP